MMLLVVQFSQFSSYFARPRYKQYPWTLYTPSLHVSLHVRAQVSFHSYSTNRSPPPHHPPQPFILRLPKRSATTKQTNSRQRVYCAPPTTQPLLPPSMNRTYTDVGHPRPTSCPPAYVVSMVSMSKSLRPWFVTWAVLTVRSCEHLTKPPDWRTTPCRLLFNILSAAPPPIHICTPLLHPQLGGKDTVITVSQ